MSSPSSRRRFTTAVLALWCLTLQGVASRSQDIPTDDVVGQLQEKATASPTDSMPRAFHFGSQGPGAEFSNHTSHTNRLVPVYTFGRKADLSAVTGKNSSYRQEARVKQLYGRLPLHTVNPEAEYADQSDLYRVQREAAEKGAKYLFTVWFDGLDWPTTQAAAIARTGQVYQEGKGSGLRFQDEIAEGSAQFGYVVTSPTRADPAESQFNVNDQSLTSLESLIGGGYDARFVGPNPWTPGSLESLAPGYLRGQSATEDERRAVVAAGGQVHAYTDSAPSAGEFATGIKMFNNGINVADDGRLVPTLYNQLQAEGWKVGTVTSVPFNHASPAAMYAHNVSRDDYQDVGREMLGLESIVQVSGKGPRLPGLDVVIGCGWGAKARESDLLKQGSNAIAGNPFITDEDLQAINADQGGHYSVAIRQAGVKGTEVLQQAAERAVKDNLRLFGFYGLPISAHLPYSTTNGDFRPAKGIRGAAERYTPADLEENPTLADMTRSALSVLSAKPGQPFALFVEPGDVDFALHDNNLDNAIGALYDGEKAIDVILDWIRQHSNWDESVVIVTADHGHYFVLDDPSALAPRPREASGD